MNDTGSYSSTASQTLCHSKALLGFGRSPHLLSSCQPHAVCCDRRSHMMLHCASGPACFSLFCLRLTYLFSPCLFSAHSHGCVQPCMMPTAHHFYFIRHSVAVPHTTSYAHTHTHRHRDTLRHHQCSVDKCHKCRFYYVLVRCYVPSDAKRLSPRSPSLSSPCCDALGPLSCFEAAWGLHVCTAVWVGVCPVTVATESGTCDLDLTWHVCICYTHSEWHISMHRVCIWYGVCIGMVCGMRL
jgi:hypothetical protein